MAYSAITVSFLSECVEREWGVVALSVQSFPGEHSLTCRFDTADGPLLVKSMTLTLGDAQRELGRLAWQVSVMKRAADSGLPVQRIVPARSGEEVCVFRRDDGRVTIVHVMNWAEGIRVDGVPMTDALAASIGDTTGRFTVALADHRRPPVDTGHHWDALNMGKSLDNMIAGLAGIEARDLVIRARALYAAQVEPVLAGLPRQSVHHDMHDFNLLVSSDNTEQVAAILDFGDTTWAPRVAELAVAAAYAARATSHPLRTLGIVTDAYRRHVQLSPTEQQLIGPLACARLALNLATWTVRGTTRTDSYAADRSAASLPALAALLAEFGD